MYTHINIIFNNVYIIIIIYCYSSSMIPLIVHIPSNLQSPPLAARAAPVWLNGSILLVAVFGVVLGLLGVVILILILYIYKQ